MRLSAARLTKQAERVRQKVLRAPQTREQCVNVLVDVVVESPNDRELSTGKRANSKVLPEVVCKLFLDPSVENGRVSHAGVCPLAFPTQGGSRADKRENQRHDDSRSEHHRYSTAIPSFWQVSGFPHQTSQARRQASGLKPLQRE